MPCLRSMQTTNRYEHSLDSAMRPVRPDGIPRRTREHPCVRAPIWGISCWRVAPRGDLEPHVHCGVSVKTSSESESVATRSPDPGEEIDLTEEHTLKPYPIRDSGVLPSPCHERDLQRTPVKARCRSRQHLLSLPRREAGAPTDITTSLRKR